LALSLQSRGRPRCSWIARNKLQMRANLTRFPPADLLEGFQNNTSAGRRPDVHVPANSTLAFGDSCWLSRRSASALNAIASTAANGLFPCGSIGHRSGKVDDLCDPAPVVFTIKFHFKSHDCSVSEVYTPASFSTRINSGLSCDTVQRLLHASTLSEMRWNGDARHLPSRWHARRRTL
jgi:hypothetical protein